MKTIDRVLTICRNQQVCLQKIHTQHLSRESVFLSRTATVPIKIVMFVSRANSTVSQRHNSVQNVVNLCNMSFKMMGLHRGHLALR